MKLTALGVLAVAVGSLASSNTKADTIFEVEHARADYRAGRVSESDVEFLQRWGRPSGCYPAVSYTHLTLPTKRIV